MRWEMEKEEIEAAMEKITDLHDKLSDAILSISRAHFFRSVRAAAGAAAGEAGGGGGGFVFVKGADLEEGDEGGRMVDEAKSLYLIRTALESLEDQLDFLQTMESHQRTEKDAAIARIEQSHIILAMRLADHHGKKYKVIEEALEFVASIGKPTEVTNGRRPNTIKRIFMSGITFVCESFRLRTANGMMGNAALFAISLLAVFQLNQASSRGSLLLEAASPMQGQPSAKKRVGISNSKVNVFSGRG